MLIPLPVCPIYGVCSLCRRLHKEHTPPDKTKKWTTFTYHSPATRKITNLFKNSAVGIAFRSKNTIFKQITNKKYEQTDPSGIYSISCNTCNKRYIGQTDSGINIRYKEHIRYIKTNNPQSAYAMHILHNSMNTERQRKHYNS